MRVACPVVALPQSTSISRPTSAKNAVGASIALHLAEAGASIVVNYASSRDGADRIVAKIVAAGGKAVAVQADVSKPADVKRLFAEAIRAFDHVDVLVNNAGIYEFAPLEEVTPEHFHKVTLQFPAIPLRPRIILFAALCSAVRRRRLRTSCPQSRQEAARHFRFFHHASARPQFWYNSPSWKHQHSGC